LGVFRAFLGALGCFLLGNAMKFGFFGAFLARLVVFGFIRI
jgi:hypothetical protein